MKHFEYICACMRKLFLLKANEFISLTESVLLLFRKENQSNSFSN